MIGHTMLSGLRRVERRFDRLHLKSCPSSSPLFLPTPALLQFSSTFQVRKLLEIKLYITGSIQSFGDVGNYRSLKAAQRSSLFRFVSLGCKYEDVRRKCFNFLPDWCHNQHYERECHQVFLNFCYNLKFTPNSTPDLILMLC